MNYWIFKANTEKYQLDNRLKDPDLNTTWRITRYREQIKAGDIAFIWRAGSPRGICALMQIESDPSIIDEIKLENYYLIEKIQKPTWRVKGRFIKRFALIDSKVLKLTAGLENLSVFHGFQQATNFIVSQTEAKIILSMIS